MTSLPPMPNYAEHILISPSSAVRQRVLDSLRSSVRRSSGRAEAGDALDDLESGFRQVPFPRMVVLSPLEIPPMVPVQSLGTGR